MHLAIFEMVLLYQGFIMQTIFMRLRILHFHGLKCCLFCRIRYLFLKTRFYALSALQQVKILYYGCKGPGTILKRNCSIPFENNLSFPFPFHAR